MNDSKTRVQMAGRIVELTAKNAQLLQVVSSVLLPVADGSGHVRLTKDRSASSQSGDWHASRQTGGLVIDLEELASLQEIEPTERNAFLLVAPLITKVLHQLESYVWIDATALLTEDGRLCLLAGASGTGKTTLTLALALKHGCRIVCEDITLIDPQQKKVLPLAVPLHLRPGTERRVKEVVDFEAGSFLRLGGWAFRSDLYSTQPVNATFSMATCFLPSGESIFGKLEVRTLDASAFLRKLLPISNTLRIPGGADVLNKVLAGATCLTLQGGTVEERLHAYLSHSCSTE